MPQKIIISAEGKVELMPDTQLANYLSNRQNAEAETYIQECRQSDKAIPIFYTLINYAAPACWLAFLNNPTICNEITHNEISRLFEHLNKCIDYFYTEHDVTPVELLAARKALVENETLCRRVSYQYFLTILFKPGRVDRLWLNYLIKNPHFLKHLDFFSLSKVMERFPLSVPHILNSLERLLTPAQIQEAILNRQQREDARIAALLLRELLARKPCSSMKDLPSLRKQAIIDKLHEHFSGSTEEFQKWIRYVARAPHLLKCMQSQTILEIAKRDTSIALPILQSLTELLPSAGKNASFAAIRLEVLIDCQPFQSRRDLGSIFFELGNYFFSLEEYDKARHYLQRAWSHDYAAATTLLVMIELNSHNYEEAWIWAQDAMKLLPPTQSELRLTLESLATQLKKIGHSLAPQVESAIASHTHSRDGIARVLVEDLQQLQLASVREEFEAASQPEAGLIQRSRVVIFSDNTDEKVPEKKYPFATTRSTIHCPQPRRPQKPK